MNYNSKDYPILAPAIFSSKTKKDLNPFMVNRINNWDKVYYSIFYLNSITGLIIYKFRKFLKMIATIFNSSNTKRKFIYAPHGSFIIFSKNFFQSGGYLDQNLTMYGEEFTTGEIANKLKIPIYYEPDIEVVHVEHSSNKINWFNNFYLTKKAFYYFLKEYLND
jgi:Predicted glycosyltransferases